MQKAHTISIPHAQVPPVRRGSRFYWIAAVLALAGIVFLPIIAICGAFLYFQVTARIYPGVTAAGVPVGMMTREQAVAEIDRAWNRERTLVLNDGSRQWATTPSFFGLWVDPGATVEAAYQVGRGQDSPTELIWLAQERLFAVDPVVTVNPAFAREQLVRWAETVDVPSEKAAIRLEGDRVAITPGKPGVGIDVDATLIGLLADPKQVVSTGVLPVSVRAIQSDAGNVDAVAADVEGMLSRSLKVTAYDPITGEHFAWEADRQTVAGWLRIEDGPAGPEVHFDAQQAGAFVQSLAGNLGATRAFDALPDAQAVEAAFRGGQALNLDIHYLPGEYVVQPGDTMLKIGWKVQIPYWRIQKANPGVSDGTLTTGQTLVLPPLDDLLPLPVVENKRIVVSITEQRLRVFQDGNQIQEFVISTGIDRSPTQPGVYQVQTHELSAYAANWDLTMPHWMGIYEAWPGFMNGFHGLPTLSNGRILWAEVLGKPASYGCIILDLDDAEWLYNWAENGVVVEIVE